MKNEYTEKGSCFYESKWNVLERSNNEKDLAVYLETVWTVSTGEESSWNHDWDLNDRVEATLYGSPLGAFQISFH